MHFVKFTVDAQSTFLEVNEMTALLLQHLGTPVALLFDE